MEGCLGLLPAYFWLGGYGGEELTWGAKYYPRLGDHSTRPMATAAYLLWKLAIRFSFLAFPRKTAYW